MPLRDGLIAEYLFDGSAADTSGNGHHGVVAGAVLTTDRFGRPNNAYQFDGVDDAITVDPPPQVRGRALSVSVWVRFDQRSLGGWTNCVIAQDDGNDEDQSRRVFQLSLLRGHVVWHRMVRARDPIHRRRTRFDRWYHLAATTDGEQHTLWIDGVRVDAITDSMRFHPAQPLHIGRKGTAERHFFLKGAVDDVRIYDRVLTDANVSALYRENGFVAPPLGSTSRESISGRWGKHGVRFLDLAEREGVVTGRVMDGRPGKYAPVRAGRFDPSAGVLQLQGTGTGPHGNVSQEYRIDAALDEGVLAVSVTFGDYADNLFFTRSGARWQWRRGLAQHLHRLVDRLLGQGGGERD